jgi:GMP synthase-like glutamine amidotransferase
VGAILQVNGDHSTVFQNAPRRYVWQWSEDARVWHDLKDTETHRERRLFRIHRLSSARDVRGLRILVSESAGDAPTLREVEVYGDPSAEIEFGDWIVSVSTRESAALPGGTGAFVSLARQCPGWERVLAQQIWIGDFDEEFVAAEPHPLCAFLTGNSEEWCQRTREPWRGVQEVLAARNLPIWGACGGVQAMAILAETGVEKPWDCPRCRDPQDPKSPIYTHIGHTGPASCGDYSKCIGERGKFNVRKTAQDPVFDGLPEVFEIMESHIGQMAWPPKGWIRVATRGPGALTVNQCLRVEDRHIYAAQFHMELPGTAENSRRIMGNFLALAKEWGGYNPKGKPVPRPEPLEK